MPHLNIYLDPASERLIARAAKRDALSLSRWAREKLVLAAGSATWPEGYESTVGSIDDASFRSPFEPDASADQTARFDR